MLLNFPFSTQWNPRSSIDGDYGRSLPCMFLFRSFSKYLLPVCFWRCKISPLLQFTYSCPRFAGPNADPRPCTALHIRAGSQLWLSVWRGAQQDAPTRVSSPRPPLVHIMQKKKIKHSIKYSRLQKLPCYFNIVKSCYTFSKRLFSHFCDLKMIIQGLLNNI